MSPIGYFLIVILLVAVIGGIFSIFYDVISFFYWRVKSYAKKYQPLSSRYQRILAKYSAYYNLLSYEDKQRFQKRVQRFMFSKRFIPRSQHEITAEMKVLISASAVQITFGLPEIYLTHFDKILVYPDSYYSRINQKYHLGEVNPRAGVIIISWKSFVDGYADLTDSFNVGIHEMAHAIHFENRIKNEEYDFLHPEWLLELDRIAKREISHINNGQGRYLRKYAGTNEYEFFAVALEHFFEDPKGFKKAIPDLYEVLSALLNQDPIKIYKLEV